MFYISSIKDDKVSIADTSDNSEEFYTKNCVKVLCDLGTDIKGLIRYDNKVHMIVLSRELAILSDSALGTPVMVRVARGLGYHQALYIGSYLDKSKDSFIFIFFNDSGLDGEFMVSSDDKEIALSFDNIDDMKTSELRRRWLG